MSSESDRENLGEAALNTIELLKEAGAWKGLQKQVNAHKSFQGKDYKDNESIINRVLYKAVAMYLDGMSDLRVPEEDLLKMEEKLAPMLTGAITMVSDEIEAHKKLLDLIRRTYNNSQKSPSHN